MFCLCTTRVLNWISTRCNSYIAQRFIVIFNKLRKWNSCLLFVCLDYQEMVLSVHCKAGMSENSGGFWIIMQRKLDLPSQEKWVWECVVTDLLCDLEQITLLLWISVSSSIKDMALVITSAPYPSSWCEYLIFKWGAWLAQSVERATLDLGVVGSSPTLGAERT